MQSVPAILTLLKMLCGGFFVVGFGFFFPVEKFCLKSRTTYPVFRTSYSGLKIFFSKKCVNGRTEILKIELLLVLFSQASRLY